MTKYMKKSELKDLDKSITDMIKNVDENNPLTVIALANTLIQIGNNILSKTSSQLINRAYSKEELMKLNPLLEEDNINPINRELQELRLTIEHYERVLREDTLIAAGELEDDGRPKLSQEDITKIKAKIEGLTMKRNELLSHEKDLALDENKKIKI